MSPPMSVKVSYILSQLLRQWTVILLTLNRSCKAFTPSACRVTKYEYAQGRQLARERSDLVGGCLLEQVCSSLVRTGNFVLIVLFSESVFIENKCVCVLNEMIHL